MVFSGSPVSTQSYVSIILIIYKYGWFVSNSYWYAKVKPLWLGFKPCQLCTWLTLRHPHHIVIFILSLQIKTNSISIGHTLVWQELPKMTETTLWSLVSVTTKDKTQWRVFIYVIFLIHGYLFHFSSVSCQAWWHWASLLSLVSREGARLNAPWRWHSQFSRKLFLLPLPNPSLSPVKFVFFWEDEYYFEKFPRKTSQIVLCNKSSNVSV